MKRATIGIDIGSYGIKLAKLKRKKNDIVAVKLVFEKYPDNLNYENLDSKNIASFITELFKKNRIKDKVVCASLHGNDVIVKNITLPPVEKSELRQAVSWEAEQYIPYNINDVSIGFQVLPSDDSSRTNVLIAAAKKETVDKRKGILRKAGLDVEIMDIDSLAIANCFEQSYDDAKDFVYLIDIGKSYTKLNILNNGITLFARDMPTGTTEFTSRISERLDISYAEAERLIQKFNADKEDNPNQNELTKIFDESCKAISTSIASSIQFFLKSDENTDAEPMQASVYVSGGGALIPGIIPYIQEELSSEVSVMNPFRAISIDPTKIDIANIKNKETIYSTSVGLALRSIF